jgi:ribose 5-phosphate isomerase A
MLSAPEIKEKLGREAASLIAHGMTIGLGTGSTVYSLIHEIGKRVRQGLQVIVVPTSLQTETLALDLGITITSLNNSGEIALTIDGADEIDGDGQLIKGGGGALLQEKMVAASSQKMVIIADHSKLVNHLGSFPLPVEVVPFGYRKVWDKLVGSLHCKAVSLRQQEGRPLITDHHHYILDCQFERIADPGGLNSILHNIPGVVETGLFVNMANEAIIGYPDGRIETKKYK